MATNTAAPVTRAEAAADRLTHALLCCGIAAGPFWVGLVLVQMATRPGFDIRRHAVSQLTLGDLGWVQMTDFIVAGALVVAFAVGVRRMLNGARGGAWGALLIGVYGLGLAGAGLFPADPAYGFPPGTPDAPGQFSSHGALHLLFASVAFLSIIAASAVVFARRFSALGEGRRMAYSIFTGAYFLVTWTALIATAARIGAVNVAFALAVLLAWAWLTVLAAGLARKVGSER